MRRVGITISAAVMVLAFAPAGALASHHHKGHHGKRHQRVERFGDVNASPTTPSSASNAGTVQSFTNGVLTLKLNDGSTPSGAVTNDTELECMASGQSPTSHDHGGGDGGSGDQSGGDDQANGEDQGNAAEQNDNDAAEDNGQGDDQNENAGQSCSTANLTPGTVVQGAELRISGAGNTWKKVELGS
jgi:hypothetical protein